MGVPKTLVDFKMTLDQHEPSSDWPKPLQALWWDAKGDWEKAHDLVDGASVPMANAVHAYLHRKEGDEWNASYWYRQAGQSFYHGALDEEWQFLVETIL